MKIECPHCGQHIEVEGVGAGEFSCPGCNGIIQLQVKAEAIGRPVIVAARPGIKLPVLIGAVTAAIVLSLLLGWLAWGRGDPEETSDPHAGLPMSERIIGMWHERTDDIGVMFFEFTRDLEFRHGGVSIKDGKPNYLTMAKGDYRVQEGFLQTRGRLSKSQEPYSEWSIQKIALKGDVLTVYPPEGKTLTLTYKRVNR